MEDAVENDPGLGQVMVVGDDPLTLSLLGDLARHESHQVATVTSGPAAIRLLTEMTPNIIFIDIATTDMDGVATLRELRQRGFAGPVVILTAKATIKAAREAMMLGVFDYIAKPVEAELLMLVLREGILNTIKKAEGDKCAP